MRHTRLIVSAILACLCLAAPTFGQTGACCNPNGSCTAWPNDSGQAICDAIGGTWLGPDTSCNANTCIGACDLPDGSCIDGVTPDVCTNNGGMFRGFGTTCLPIGACCFPDGTCSERSMPDCKSSGGDYQGDDSSCDGIECELPVGACCMPDGSCMDEQIESECEDNGGTYQGDDTGCAGVVCEPLGACCILESGECFDNFTQVECEEKNPFGTGEWQGAGSQCTDIGCPLFGLGACCLPSGECFDFEDEGVCLSLGGTYGGDNSL